MYVMYQLVLPLYVYNMYIFKNSLYIIFLSQLLEQEEAEYMLVAMVPEHNPLVFWNRLDFIDDQSYGALESTKNDNKAK